MSKRFRFIVLNSETGLEEIVDERTINENDPFWPQLATLGRWPEVVVIGPNYWTLLTYDQNSADYTESPGITLPVK